MPTCSDRLLNGDRAAARRSGSRSGYRGAHDGGDPRRRRRRADPADARAHARRRGVRGRGGGRRGAALAAIERSVPDLLVLDVAMPGIDGLAVCRRAARKGLATPILLLTARDAVADRVDGLDAGADDYLVKPFATEELLARVRALLRRGREPVRAARVRRPDVRRRDAHRPPRRPRGRAEPREADLLELLLRNARQRRHARAALDARLGQPVAASANSVDRYVSYLRRKLGEPPLIETVRGSASCSGDDEPLAARPLGARRGARRSCSPSSSSASVSACSRRAICIVRSTVAAPARDRGRAAQRVGAGAATAPGALDTTARGRRSCWSRCSIAGAASSRARCRSAAACSRRGGSRARAIATRAGRLLDARSRAASGCGVYAAPLADFGGSGRGWRGRRRRRPSADVERTLGSLRLFLVLAGARRGGARGARRSPCCFGARCGPLGRLADAARRRRAHRRSPPAAASAGTRRRGRRGSRRR